MKHGSDEPETAELENAVAYQVVRAARVLRNHLVRFLAERAELTAEPAPEAVANFTAVLSEGE